VYADDISLISDKKEHFQNAVIEWGSIYQDRGLEINTAKTKIMKISKVQDNEELNIKWNESTLEVVEQYNYLGVIVTNDGRTDKEINNRIEKASQIYYEINNMVQGKKEVEPKAKIQIYKSVHIPTLKYGAESWQITTKHESRIVATEMKFLRRIVGKTRRDKWRNNRIRETLDQEPILNYIERRSIKLYDHVLRMQDYRKPKQAMEARKEKRGRGKSRKSWEDCVIDTARREGNTLADLRRVARDRNAFRQWTEDPTLQGSRGR
jgi:hypothetical protein